MTNNEQRANDRADSLADTAPSTTRSYLRRLTYTPLRDLLRLRASGRLDLETALATSGLPASTQALIKRVVKKTRLWPLERAEVAHELIAHFRDAAPPESPESAGSPAIAAAVERAFGEPRAAARLIARAKRRNRSFLVRYTLRAMKWGTVAALLLACVYAHFVVRFYGDQPTITRDYLAELNAAALTVPDHERAAPLYAHAAASMLGEIYASSDKLHPGTTEWQIAAAFFDARTDVIDVIRDAASRPALGHVLTTGDGDYADRSLYRILLPYLEDIRRCYVALLFDTRRAVESGEYDRATQNLLTMPRMAAHARETPFLIAELVSVSLHSSWAREVSELLARRPEVFTDDALAALGALARSHRLTAEVRFDYERMMIHDFVQRVYTDDGKGDGRFTAVGLALLDGYAGSTSESPFTAERSLASALLAPAAAARHPSRREFLAKAEEMYNAIEQEQNKPLWERDYMRYYDLATYYKAGSIEAKRYFMVNLLMPAFVRASTNGPLLRQRLDALDAAIALELFRRDNGRWPESLNELTPGRLAAVPLDQFDGKPLRYRVVDGEPILYSVGFDRVDNGGAPYTLNNESIPDAAGRWESIERVRDLLANPDTPGSSRYGLNADWVHFSPALARLMHEQRTNPPDPEREFEAMDE